MRGSRTTCRWRRPRRAAREARNEPTRGDAVRLGLVSVLSASQGAADSEECGLSRSQCRRRCAVTRGNDHAQQSAHGSSDFHRWQACRRLRRSFRTRSQRGTGSINSGGLMNEVRTPGPEANIGGVQVSLQSVYLKDCSYESPNRPRLPNNQGWEPKFQLNMNTSAEELAADVREVLLTITLEAKQGEATLYLVEVKQAGVFSIAGASVEDLKRLIGSFCPSVLFPYAREVISDLIVKGGFPNFLLPLVNFDALFAQASEAPQTGLVN